MCSTFPLLDMFLVFLVYHPVFQFGHYLPCILESTYCRIGPKMVSSAPTILSYLLPFPSGGTISQLVTTPTNIICQQNIGDSLIILHETAEVSVLLI